MSLTSFDLPQIVGGTGITPAYQLLNTLISQCSYLGTPLPTFTLLYAASKPSSLLLLPELAALQQEFPQQINIRLHVDELDMTTKQSMSWADWLLSKPPSREGLDLHEGRISQDAVRQVLEKSKESGSRRILVCGPDGMISYIAGPKQGKLQGQLSGILASLQCKEDEVWKL
jgi:cytochrome-b5 reductase